MNLTKETIKQRLRDIMRGVIGGTPSDLIELRELIGLERQKFSDAIKVTFDYDFSHAIYFIDTVDQVADKLVRHLATASQPATAPAF